MKYNPILWVGKFLFPTKNVAKNKEDILNLLFISEFQELTTEESINLFNEVEKAFHLKLSERYIHAQIEASDIEKQFKEKELVLKEKFANLRTEFLHNHPDISKLDFQPK